MTNKIDDHNLRVIIPIVEQATKLAQKHSLDRSKPIPIIGVAGRCGVGKTYFINEFKHLLQNQDCNVYILKQTNFSDPDQIPPDALVQITSKLNWKLIHETVQKIQSGQRKLTIPAFNKNERPRVEVYQEIDLTNIDLIIFDGSFALTGPDSFNFFSFCTFGIFLDSSEENINRWRLAREKAKPKELQRSPEDFNKSTMKAHKKYVNYILPTKKNAAFVIHKDQDHRYTLTVQDVKSKNE